MAEDARTASSDADAGTAESAGPEGAPVPGARQRSPLEQLASFRFTYLAIFVFLVAYVFTVEGMEELLRGHFQAQATLAAEVDPTEGPVADQIRARLGEAVLASRWVHPGGVRVRPLVLAADGRTLLSTMMTAATTGRNSPTAPTRPTTSR